MSSSTVCLPLVSAVPAMTPAPGAPPPPSVPPAALQALQDAATATLQRHYEGAIVSYGQASVLIADQLANQPSDPVLTKFFHYVIPLGLGDCKAAIADWNGAQNCYRLASGYAPLDAVTESPQLWAKFAALYVAWGDSVYLAGDPTTAAGLYGAVITAAGGVPNSVLYTLPSLAAGATMAKTVIASLPQLLTDPATAAPHVDPTIATPVVGASVKLGQIAAGLHYYGFALGSVPVWTFDYLQQVATQYCQWAVTSEQNVINFWDRADAAQLTGIQLDQHVADSVTALDAARKQFDAAGAEVAVYRSGLSLAQTRATDAQGNVTDYQVTGSQAMLYSALAAQVGGGRDGDPDIVNAQADAALRREPVRTYRADIVAGDQLAAARLTQQYEVAALGRTATDMRAAVAQAEDEITAANARVAAAAGVVTLAQLHVGEAQAVVANFNSDTFTATVWKTMGDRLYTLYRRYLDMALRAARLMQQAYNFENDDTVDVIRADYSANEVRGLLAADMLLADISSFADYTLTNRRSTVQPITHTVSLASRHSYSFETTFRTNGVVEFDTTPEDFDLFYPGAYGGRIVHVDVTVQGLVPTSGISGTLTNGGVSFYRTPTDTWTDSDPDHMRRRIQPSETLVISEFDRRDDPTLAVGDGRQPGIFAGAGVISSWRLEIPPEINDIDYALVTDVLVTFTYTARFDYQLATTVKQLLAGQPGAHTTQLGLPLRWLYPDVFYNLIAHHTTALHVSPSDLPLNQTATQLTQIGVLVTPGAGHPPTPLKVDVTAPGSTAASTATTDDKGLITSTTAGSALTGQLGHPVTGDWTIAVSSTDPTVDISSLANVTLLLEYAYTPRAAAAPAATPT